MSTQTANNMRAFAPADRIPISAAYLAGRRAHEEGRALADNPGRRLSVRWQQWELGWRDSHWTVPVSRRAA